jgi:hypothetical protein
MSYLPSPLHGRDPEDDRDTSYQANIPFLQGQLMAWKVLLGPLERTFLKLKRLTHEMLHTEPADRPTAKEISELIGSNFCCGMGSEELEATSE